jgi:hypothetical protein
MREVARPVKTTAVGLGFKSVRFRLLGCTEDSVEERCWRATKGRSHTTLKQDVSDFPVIDTTIADNMGTKRYRIFIQPITLLKGARQKDEKMSSERGGVL